VSRTARRTCRGGLASLDLTPSSCHLSPRNLTWIVDSHPPLRRAELPGQGRSSAARVAAARPEIVRRRPSWPAPSSPNFGADRWIGRCTSGCAWSVYAFCAFDSVSPRPHPPRGFRRPPAKPVRASRSDRTGAW
jgi:hypothetical protein